MKKNIFFCMYANNEFSLRILEPFFIIQIMKFVVKHNQRITIITRVTRITL